MVRVTMVERSAHPTEQQNVQLSMIRLPDRICSCCLPPVNKIKVFAIRFAAMMREGQKAAGNPHEPDYR